MYQVKFDRFSYANEHIERIITIRILAIVITVVDFLGVSCEIQYISYPNDDIESIF